MIAAKRNIVTTCISQRAVGDLHYIRNTIETAGELTRVPGRAGIAMGLIGLTAAGLCSSGLFAPYWLSIWLAAAVIAIISGARCMAHSLRQRLWRGSAGRLSASLAPAIAAGAALTGGLIVHDASSLIPAVWLLCYGAAVASTGASTIRPVALMGLCFLLLGCCALVLPQAWSNILLGVGFGGLHIGFGLWLRHAGC